MTDKSPFTGDGFSREPFSEDENAKHREMHKSFGERWESVKAIDEISKGGVRVAKIVGTLTVLGAVAGYLVKQGFI